ncbi:hypothetical protein [Klebsiella pneumoniae]|uniref:hypothetical protein n=1 Tax=Klebsiella pneumoniae TaxID=573 RepID=UPI0029DCE225|nr:hypothetical protein [Klebsiella pneumoniae]MDX6872445.1 hypothetical protein [Klebsiella pneumoniae]
MADNEKLGSTSPEVLLKNVVILDKLVSDKEKESLPDRFGALRRTWYGMEMIFSRFIDYITGRGEQAVAAIGWQELGDWAIGLTVENRNQVVGYNGAWYKYLGELEHVIAGDSPENDGGVWSAENPTGKWSNIGDAALRSNLGSSDGFGLVGQVASFTALRSVAPNTEGQSILLRAHPVGWAAMSHGPVGGGEFIARKGTSVDDGGYICVPTGQNEYYWQRIPKNPGKVCATEFGLYDGATLDVILDNAVNFCIKNSLGYLSVPALGPAGYTLMGGLEFINSTNGLIIEGPGMATKGAAPIITHTGANIGLTFKRKTQAQSIFNTVILKNFTVAGNALATAFVRFSDFYGGSVLDSVIRDYTTGTAIDVYNGVGWTETVRVDNVMVRTSKIGIWYHSDPLSTDWQTVSFFGAVIRNYGFQHGIGGASYGICVGDGSRADNLYNCVIDMTGWWEQGGNSTALYVNDKAIVDGEATFRYDGFAASPMASTTQPTRLIRKNGYAGYVKLNCENYKHQAGIGLTAGVTSLTIRPWLALAESLANIATPHPTLPGEHIITAPGLKCKLTGNIIQGQDSIVQVRSLPAWHRYKVTLRSGLSSTAQQQYIVNTHSDNNAGTVTRTDSVSAANTNLVAGTSNYSTTLSNKNFPPFYLRNAGGLPDNTYSESYRRGFDLVLNGTSALVTEALVAISMEIEAID